MNRSSDPGGRSTLASSVYDSLRHEILSGSLPPGEKLRIEMLRQRLQTGATPIREALNRLAAEGLVVQQDQRGFRIPPVSLEELTELTRTRCWLNEIALREAIARGGADWEERIVVAFHRLSRADAAVGTEAPISPDWAQRHRAFHESLIAGCGSRWIEQMAMDLFDRADRYRHLSVMAQRPQPVRDVGAEHRAIMEAVLARDAGLAIALLNEHISLTAELVAQGDAPSLGLHPALAGGPDAEPITRAATERLATEAG